MRTQRLAVERAERRLAGVGGDELAQLLESSCRRTRVGHRRLSLPFRALLGLHVLLEHGIACAQRLQLGLHLDVWRAALASSMYSMALFFRSRPPVPRFFSSWPSIAGERLDRVDVLRAQFGAAGLGQERDDSQAACRSWSAPPAP